MLSNARYFDRKESLCQRLDSLIAKSCACTQDARCPVPRLLARLGGHLELDRFSAVTASTHVLDGALRIGCRQCPLITELADMIVDAQDWAGDYGASENIVHFPGLPSSSPLRQPAQEAN